MEQHEAEFGARLDLALKLLNISRGTVAAETRVDKSLVSRWLRGLAAPRGHNLVALTELVRQRAPNFTQLSWTLSPAAFQAALGHPASAPELLRPSLPDLPETIPAVSSGAAAALSPAIFLAASRAQSNVEVGREGHAYPGVYVSFRLAFRNTGRLLAELMVIWRQGGRLLFRQYDPSFSHAGELLVLRHQLFFVGEDDARVDGLFYLLMNGVTGQKAMRLDGLLMTVLNDRDRTPGATLVVFQRLADLAADDTPPAEAEMAPLRRVLGEAYHEGRVDQLAGPEIAQRIRPTIGAPGAGGAIDYILRAPPERSLCATEMDWSEKLAASVRAVRAAVIGEATGFPFVEPGDTIRLPHPPGAPRMRLVAN